MLGFVVGIFVGWVADSQLKKIQRWPLRVPAYLVTWIAFQWIFFIVSIIIGIATTAELTEGPGFMGMTFGMTVALLLSLFRGPYEEIDEQQQLLDDVVARQGQ